MTDIEKKLEIILESYLTSNDVEIVNNTIKFLTFLTSKPIISFFTNELYTTTDNIFKIFKEKDIFTQSVDIINKISYEISIRNKWNELSNMANELYLINNFADKNIGNIFKVNVFDTNYIKSFNYLTLLFIRLQAENAIYKFINKNLLDKEILIRKNYDNKE